MRKEAPAWSEDADLVSDEGEAAMIAIPAGTAKVGLRHNELAEKIEENPRISERRKEETLYRSMKMGALRIDRYEVTNGNYYKFLQTLDEKARKEWEPRHHIRRLAHPQWTDGHYKSGTGNFPVTGIPFEAAEAYAKWRGKRGIGSCHSW